MQQVHVAPPVVVVQEARQAIVTALDHMPRYPRQIETREASHAMVSSQSLKMKRVDRRFPGQKLPSSAAEVNPEYAKGLTSFLAICEGQESSN
jgi:hypothetical protein